MFTRRRALALAGLAAARWALPDAARAQPLDDSGLPLPRFNSEPEPPTPEQPAALEPEPEQAPPAPVPSLLDGVLLPPEDAWRNDLLPIAVSLDNFAGGARPQFGMDKADLVYELLVEGGITRFMAVYHRRECEHVKPVRSARTPMLEICKELGAVLGHIGAASVAGPADADSQFSWWGVPHFDGDISWGPFWRDRRRYAPHNAVTSTVELRGHALGLGWHGPSALAPWRFKDDGEEDGVALRPARHLGYGFALTFGAFNAFRATFNYERDENLYFRSMGGTYHFDGMTGEQLTAANVIIQLAPAWQGSRQGHVLYDLVGEGVAFIFRDGHVYETVWSKRSREERTRYRHPAGEEFRFNRGRTWVALVPLGSPYWWS